MRRATGERGQVTILVLGLALVAFAVAGLAVDGTRAFLMRRTLQNAADSSALAGAAELEASTYYATGGRVVILDPAAARRSAVEWLQKRGLRARPNIGANGEEVRVELRARVATTFLSFVGIHAIPVAAEATAQPLAGTAPEP